MSFLVCMTLIRHGSATLSKIRHYWITKRDQFRFRSVFVSGASWEFATILRQQKQSPHTNQRMGAPGGRTLRVGEDKRVRLGGGAFRRISPLAILSASQ